MGAAAALVKGVLAFAGSTAGQTAIVAASAAASSEEQRKSASKSASKQRKLLGKVSEPQATPEVGTGARDELRRRAKARLSGRKKTIVTGDLTPATGKKSVLG